MRISAVLALIGALATFAQAAFAQGWARTDLRPVTQPAPVGGLFVLEAAQSGALSVVALDAETGATVWSARASTSAIVPGVAPELAVADGKVIYLAADGTSAAVVAADGQTGQPLWSTGPGTFTGTPATCDDDPSAICVAGVLASDSGDVSAMRFDIATGRRLPAAHVRGPSPRELGVGLYDPGDREPEQLSATRGPEVAWTRPLARIFPLRGATTDYGWIFSRIDRLGLFVGSVGNAPSSRRGRTIFDRTRNMTAGFRIADGVVRWRTPGIFLCGILPCPGDSQAGYSTPDEGPGTRVGLRAVERGTVSYSNSHPDAPGTVSRDARIRLEGFAPATGRTVWRFDAGRNTGLLDFASSPAQIDANTVLLTGDRGNLFSIDLASGARRTLTGDARGWCRRLIRYRQNAGYDTGSGTVHTYIGQSALVWCAARSQRRLAPPPTVPGFVGDIGARNGGLIAWADTGGVIAAPQG